MKIKWHFNEHPANQKAKESDSDQFFTSDDLENISEALIREGIQNSLDAAVESGNEPVSIKITIVDKANEKTKKFVENLYSTGIKHFESGLRDGNIQEILKQDFRYLVFEDFSTIGLIGNEQETRPSRAAGNAFFSYFRSEGFSAKKGTKNIGRHGIGKAVFPISSMAHSIFGLTIRSEEPKKLLMGICTVTNHSIGEKDYVPDGWFGTRDSDEEAVMPLNWNANKSEIEEISKSFRLKRDEHPGLSIIVPFLDERVNELDIKRAVVKSFFLPILQGKLLVEIFSGEDCSDPVIIDAEKILEMVDLLNDENERKLVEMAISVEEIKPDKEFALDAEFEKKPDWSEIGDKLLTPEVAEKINERLETGEVIGIRVPVYIQLSKDKNSGKSSYFKIYFLKEQNFRDRTVYIRDGIIISGIKSKTIPGFRSIVVADHEGLALMLGDSEGVNHTEWNKDSRKFHRKYLRGADIIRFVVSAPYEVFKRVKGEDTKGDPTLFLDYFSVPVTKTGVGNDLIVNPKVVKPHPPKPPTPPNPPRPNPSRYTIDKLLINNQAAFVIKSTSTQFASYPVKIRIKAGYAVRRGNPISQWEADDFVFIQRPLTQCQATGVNISNAFNNTIELEIISPNFSFGVTGFDPNRDLDLKINKI
jgi:hypothetical protein